MFQKKIYKYDTNKRPLILQLTIRVSSPCALLIKGFDGRHINTTYFEKGFHSDKIIKGDVTYYFSLPLTPEVLFVTACNKANGSTDGIEIASAKYNELSVDDFSHNNKKLEAFVRHWIKFAEKAGYMQVGDYSIPEKEIWIKYSDVIKDLKTGSELKTPARVFRYGIPQFGKKAGEMEFSKRDFAKMTIPMRIISGLHEAGHYYLNTSNELECDKFAYNIYRKFGFSKNEAVSAMTKILMPLELDNSVNPKWKEEANFRTKKMYDYINNRV
jgi:hypothetical protein